MQDARYGRVEAEAGADRVVQPDRLGLGCAAFCRRDNETLAGVFSGGPHCVPLCEEDSYNWRVGALLIGWTGIEGGRRGGRRRGGGMGRERWPEAVVAGTAVEAAIYFWAAVRECPQSCAAWQGLAVSLMVCVVLCTCVGGCVCGVSE